MSKREMLNDGESPFHQMTKEELVYWACRLMVALTSNASIVRQCASGDDSLFWTSKHGSGFRAKAQAEPIFEHFRKKHGPDYWRWQRGFSQVLTGVDSGTKWFICDDCKVMTGELIPLGSDEPEPQPRHCDMLKCPTKPMMRPVELRDFPGFENLTPKQIARLTK